MLYFYCSDIPPHHLYNLEILGEYHQAPQAFQDAVASIEVYQAGFPGNILVVLRASEEAKDFTLPDDPAAPDGALIAEISWTIH